MGPTLLNQKEVMIRISLMSCGKYRIRFRVIPSSFQRRGTLEYQTYLFSSDPWSLPLLMVTKTTIFSPCLPPDLLRLDILLPGVCKRVTPL